MSLPNRTRLDDLLGIQFHFMGANVQERVFRLRDQEGNDYLFHAEGDKRTITDIAPIEGEPPRGCKRDEPLAEVVISQYNKQDNFRHAIAPGTPFTQAQWNRGYRLVDCANGHPWLLIGIDNYKGTRPRAVFTYSMGGGETEEDEDAE